MGFNSAFKGLIIIIIIIKYTMAIIHYNSLQESIIIGSNRYVSIVINTNKSIEEATHPKTKDTLCKVGVKVKVLP